MVSPTYDKRVQIFHIIHMLSMCTTVSVGFEAFICRPDVNILILLSLKPIMISLYCKQEQWKEPLTLWQLTESRWVFFALSHLLVTETENLEMQIPKPCKQFHLRQTFTSNYGIFVYHNTLTRCQTEEYKYWFYLIRFGARESVCNSHNQFRWKREETCQ